MFIYLLTISITVALAWLVEHVKQKKTVFSIMVLIPTIVSGLRGVGTDYFGYSLRYDKVLSGVKVDFDGTNLSGVFYQIIKFIGNMLCGYQSVIFVFSLFTIGIAFYVFYKLRKELSFTFAVFSYMTLLYLYSFNLFRQFLSAELFILALLFIREKKSKKFVVIPIVLSIIIHSSSIIYLLLFLLMPIIRHNDKARKCIYFGSTLFIALIPCLATVLGKVATILPHYAYYFMHFHYMGLGVGIFRYILLVWIPVYLCSNKKRMFSCDVTDGYTEFLFIAMMGSILSLLSYVSDTFMYRIGYTGLCALPVVLAVLIENIKKKRQLFTFTLVVFHLAFMFYDFFYINTGEIIPYTFFGR